MDSKHSCEAQVGILNRALATCPTVPGSLACNRDVVEGAAVLVDTSACAESAAAINAVVREYRGPAGSGETVECAFGRHPFDSSDCEATAATLNAMVEAYQQGAFLDCKVTTPTTSQSSSPSTSATTSPTTSTTPTKSRTTTLTTSATTTSYASSVGCIVKYGNVFVGSTTCAKDAAVINRCIP